MMRMTLRIHWYMIQSISYNEYNNVLTIVWLLIIKMHPGTLALHPLRQFY